MNAVVKTYINEKGIKTNYAVFGKGKKIFVMIPGLSIKPVTESADEVAMAYGQFANDYTVYLFDRSTPVNDKTDTGSMAEDLFEALTALNISGAYFFGASQGGMILQELMINHPETVKKAVLGSTAAKADSVIKSKIGDWRDLAKGNNTRELYLEFFRDVYSEELMKTLGEGINGLIPECSEEELAAFSAMANISRNFDVENKLQSVKCPVLVIGSKKDKVIPWEAQAELAKAVGAELYLYEGFGHAVYDEAPDYKERLLNFFAE